MADMPRVMRVLHLTFNMGIGGTEQVIRQLIRGTSKAPIYNAVLCIDGTIGSIGQALQAEGTEIVSIKRNRGFDRKLIRLIRAQVRSGGFDVVHCHQYTPFLYGRLAAFGTGARVVFTEHGRFYPDRYRYKAALINPIMAMTTHGIVAISEATRKSLSRYEFMPSGKIQVIYNGIQGLIQNSGATAAVRQGLGIPPDAFVVGTVSRLDSVKNQTMMIRAFQRFHEKCPNTYLLIVGDGPERDSLFQLVSGLRLSEWVVFTGFIEAPASHLAAMDIFLLSSYTEGTSMTLLEAMSLGIPSVATEVGGNPEILTDGITGRLVPSNDEKAFSEAMIQLYENPALRQALSENSRARFEVHFTVAAMAEQYLALYTRLLQV